MMTPHSSAAIANEFLKRAQAEGYALTHMHLQKLIYIAHGWNLVVNNKPLLDEQFQAWDIGPILHDLYRSLRRYGTQPVTCLLRKSENYYSDNEGIIQSTLSQKEKTVIDQIWNEFKDLKSFQLSALTHQDGTPWKILYNHQNMDNSIANNDIKKYFQNLID